MMRLVARVTRERCSSWIPESSAKPAVMKWSAKGLKDYRANEGFIRLGNDETDSLGRK